MELHTEVIMCDSKVEESTGSSINLDAARVFTECAFYVA